MHLTAASANQRPLGRGTGYKRRVQPKERYSGLARVHGKISLLVLAIGNLPKTLSGLFGQTENFHWLVYVPTSAATNMSSAERLFGLTEKLSKALASKMTKPKF